MPVVTQQLGKRAEQPAGSLRFRGAATDGSLASYETKVAPKGQATVPQGSGVWGVVQSGCPMIKIKGHTWQKDIDREPS